MGIKYMEDTIELAANMLDSVESEHTSVSCIAKYDIISSLINDLVLVSDNSLDLDYIYLEPEYFSGYDKEYYCIVSEGKICVEKAYKNGNYLLDDSEKVFISSECYPSILSCLDTDDSDIIYFTFETNLQDDYDDSVKDDNSETNVTSYSYVIPFIRDYERPFFTINNLKE